MKLKGTYTVEASILFPIVIIIIVCTIYVGWWLHNASYLRSAANMAAVYGVGSILREDSDSIGRTQKYAESLIESGLFGNMDVDVTVSYEKVKGIKVEYEGRMQYPLNIIGKYFGKQSYKNIRVSCQRPVIKSCKLLHFYQTIKETHGT